MDKFIYKLIFYLLFFSVFESKAQFMFNDSFENGLFGDWENTGHWIVSNQSPLTGTYSLRHNLTGLRSSSYIDRKIVALGFNDNRITWSFKLKNGNWTFGATEQLCFYLVSDKADLTTANGYAIGVNLTSGDNILKLSRIENGKAVKDLVLTDFVWKISTSIEVEVTHEFGLWSVKFREEVANTWSEPKTCTEKVFNFSFDHIGLFFKFNTSHGGQVWMDDVTLKTENCAPAIFDVRSIGRNNLLILFSKKLSQEQLLVSDNYRITTSTGTPVEIGPVWKAVGDTAGVYLQLGSFNSWDLHIKIANLKDIAGVALTGYELDFKFVPDAQFGDIVFNEIMADPTPVVRLPNKEFVELKSTCNFEVNLKNWIIEVNGKQKILTDMNLEPGQYLILSGTGGSAIWGTWGANMEITGLSLPNNGEILKLYSPLHVLIDSFSYTPGLHHDGYRDGGYSLERIDPLRICGVSGNWETSTSDKGGTPGAENSVFKENQDHTPPAVTSVSVASPSQLEICVSERLDNQIDIATCLSFSPSLPGTDSIRVDPDQLKFSIYFPKETIKNGIVYGLTFKDLTDECGNRSGIGHCEFWYYLPKPLDLLINEVLFNPFPGGVDFVEVYNNSGKKIELSEMYIASRDDSLKIKSIYPLSASSAVLLDTQYAAFTPDSAVLMANYFSLCPECIYKMAWFPAYNMDEGRVVLLNKQLEVIDEFHYLESMHDPLITEVKGISLERTSFTLQTDNPLNWHSASKSVGFATPGYKNSSIGYEPKEATGLVSFEPEIFSPNDDGINDRFQIRLSPGEPGLMVNIRIYNGDGIEIRRLANNLTIGATDLVEWDGTTENHQKAKLGIYIVKVELFGLNRKRQQFKTACVLTDRLE